MENTSMLSISVYGNQAQVVASQDNSGVTYVAASVDYGCIHVWDANVEKMQKLLIRAVNNRTRERNYFKKYVELLEGEISESDFEDEIMTNEDEYVVPIEDVSDSEEMIMAMRLIPEIKGVETTDDFVSLFSFSDQSIDHCMKIASKEGEQKLRLNR